MNLRSSNANHHSLRPHQTGHVAGRKSGTHVRFEIEWMIDTGADIGVVRKIVGDKFDLVATAASASPTNGGGGILIKQGLQVEFTAEDSVGIPRAMRSALPVGVKSSNAGSDIIGMDQLATLNVEVNWSPNSRVGTLKKI